MKNGIHVAGKVSYQLTALNSDGSVARKLPPRRNLLLDRGLDNLAALSWCSLFDYFHLGTGTGPTSRDSGLITFTLAGGIATASAAFFLNTDTLRILKLDSGREMRITGFTDDQHVTVDFAGADGPSQGTVWYVTDTALTAQDQYFNLRSGDAGDHGWLWNGVTGILSTWVTRVSNAVVAPAITFKEIGWSELGYTGLVNGRDLIAGGAGDTLTTGQKYKVKLQLDRTISPLAARACPQITGWAGTAQEQIEAVGLSYWDANGDHTDYIMAHEPVNAGRMRFSHDATAFRAPVFVGDGVNPLDLGTLAGSERACTNQAYLAGSFFRDTRAFWDAGISTAVGIRHFAYGSNYSTMYHQRMLMDADQVKASADKLIVNFRKSWGRILVN